MNNKKLEKVIKILGQEITNEIKGMSLDELKEVIVAANQAMDAVQRVLDANPKYQEVKEQKSSLEEGKKEVNKYQRAKIAYCLMIMAGDLEDLK